MRNYSAHCHQGDRPEYTGAGPQANLYLYWTERLYGGNGSLSFSGCSDIHVGLERADLTLQRGASEQLQKLKVIFSGFKNRELWVLSLWMLMWKWNVPRYTRGTIRTRIWSTWLVIMSHGILRALDINTQLRYLRKWVFLTIILLILTWSAPKDHQETNI